MHQSVDDLLGVEGWARVEPVRFGTGLPSEARVIDVGAPDASLARQLASDGLGRYLGLVPADELATAREGAAEFAVRLQPMEDATIVGRCSADLIVLRKDHARILWALRDLHRFRWIAVEAGDSLVEKEIRLAARFAVARGRLERFARWTHEGVRFDVYRLTEVRVPEPRMYFSPVWGVEGLAARLAAEKIRYLVLRWFDALPHIDPGEDLDMLVADDDLDRFRELVETEPGTIPIDAYSVTGLDGSDFLGAAYYAPELASRMLERAETHSSGMRVPPPEDHLHSLAYHALYHKGAGSQLASTLVSPPDEAPDHDYRAVLDAVATECGVVLPTDMEGIDDYLDAVGWRPAMDALRRLALNNDWLARRLSPRSSVACEDPQVATFLVRERALEVLTVDEIIAVLERMGFETVHSSSLDDAARERGARMLRGGNWGRGPFPLSGGGPSHLLVSLHYAPATIEPGLRARYPYLANEDIFYAKQAIRQLVETRVSMEGVFNAIHSADDEHEAWEYVEILAPHLLSDIREEAGARRRAQDAAVDVTSTLSRGRRARVDVIETSAGPAVRKTFTPTAMTHFRREVDALEQLGSRTNLVPPILERGASWFTLPYYADELRRYRGRLLPLALVRRIVQALREIHRLGYDLADAKPDNFILDRSHGLKAVDLEFAYPRAVGDSTALAESGNFTEVDPAAYLDVPVGDSSYEKRWLDSTGMPLSVLLDGSLFAQHAHRALFRLRALTVAPGSPGRRAARNLRSTARAVRGSIRRLYMAWVAERAWHFDDRRRQRGVRSTRKDGRDVL